LEVKFSSSQISSIDRIIIESRLVFTNFTAINHRKQGLTKQYECVRDQINDFSTNWSRVGTKIHSGHQCSISHDP